MILITIAILAIPIILIIALFTHKGITEATAINIRRPQQEVFNYLLLLRNQEAFNAWLMADPAMKKEYTGTDGTPGCTQAWESETHTNGKALQRIVSITAPRHIEIELVFEKPMVSKARYRLELNPVTDSETQVMWTYEGNMSPYYLLRVSQLLFRLKRKVRGYMNKSLANLKAVLEG